MRKFGKIVFTTISIAAVVGGIFYFLNKRTNKNDLEENELDIDNLDSDTSDINMHKVDSKEAINREYVTINLTEEPKEKSELEEK